MTGPEEKSAARQRWSLSGKAFDRLLLAFDPDREAASHKYEALRRKLIDLFAWERSVSPEDLADETLNRLARRVSEGTDIPNLDRYAYGIARLLLQEEARAYRTRAAAMRDLHLVAGDTPDPAMLDRLRRCLADLPAASRELLERYYAEDREQLARDQGISLNALRNRVLRLRRQLFDCVRRGRDI
jgi:DNA-directed RNA polymerase specialized sigma24 family protein